MKRVLLPANWKAPAVYSQAYEVVESRKTVYVAGQVGIHPDGTCAVGVEAQTRLAYANIQAILAEAGLGLQDIVKATVFLVNPNDAANFSTARTECLQGHKPASTLVYVKALAHPDWLVEVDVIAVAD